MSKEAFCYYHIDNHLHQGLGLFSNLFLRIRIPSQWNKIREFGGPRSTLRVSRRQPGLPPTSFWFLSPGQSAARSRLSKVSSEDSLRQASSKYLEERRLSWKKKKKEKPWNTFMVPKHTAPVTLASCNQCSTETGSQGWGAVLAVSS